MKRYLALRDAWIRLRSFAGLGFFLFLFFFGGRERESSIRFEFFKSFFEDSRCVEVG